MIAAAAERSRSAAEPRPTSPATPPAGSTSAAAGGATQLALAVRLAHLLLRPSDFVDPSRLSAGALGSAEIKRMAVHPGFRKPVNRLLSAALGFGDVDIGAPTLERLASVPRSRLAVLIMTEPMDAVSRAAAVLAAAVLSRRVLRLVLKSDRQRLREMLSEQELDIAAHEAPLLSQVLGDLDLGTSDAGLAAGPDVAERRRRFLGFGYCALGRFLDTSEPAFADIFAQRLPPDTGYEQRSGMIGPLAAVHCEHVVKLIRRRQQPWLAIIA